MPWPKAKPKYLQFLRKYLAKPNIKPKPKVNKTWKRPPLMMCQIPNNAAAIMTSIHLCFLKKPQNVS